MAQDASAEVDDPDIASIVQGLNGPPPAAPAAASTPANDADITSIMQGLNDPAPSAPAPTHGAVQPPHIAPPHHQTRFQAAVAPRPANQPEPSWADTLTSAAQNAIPSLSGAAESIIGAVSHPVKTAQALGQLGTGLVSQAAGALGAQQDPVQKAHAEALANALEQHYGQTYGSVSGFKQALGTDPASIAMDAATFLDGAGAVAKVGGLSKAAGILSKVGSAVDPVANAMRLASIPAKLISNPVTRQIQGVLTDVPPSLLKVAQQAGETTDPTLRAAFLRHYSGQGTAGEFLQTAQKALNQVKQDASTQYLAGKGNLINDPVDFSNTYGVLDDAQKELGMGASAGFPVAKQAIADARDYVDSVANQTDPAARNLVNADALKQQIWDLRDSTSNSRAQQMLGKVYNGIKTDISAVDPGYQTLMESYQDGLNNLTDITKTFGLGRNPAASSSLAKALRAMKKGSGDDVLTQLAGAEPTLPYMMAGSALSPWTAGGARNALEAGISFPWAIAAHNPAPIIIQALGQSPKVAGALNYASGALGRAGGNPALSLPARSAYYTGRVGQEAEAPTAPEPPPTPGKMPPPTSDDVDAATRMILSEAGNQPDQGKAAALYTAINRAKQAGQPLSTVIAAPYAYEGVDNGNAAKIDPNSPQYQYVRDNIVLPALSGNLDDPTNGMTHFINKSLQLKEGRKIPSWAQSAGLQIGDHTFYSANGGRITRASGGRTARTKEQLVQRLLTLAQKAKQASNEATKPLLKVPDNTVAKALEVAKAAI